MKQKYVSRKKYYLKRNPISKFKNKKKAHIKKYS